MLWRVRGVPRVVGKVRVCCATAPRADEMGRAPLVYVAGRREKGKVISRSEGDTFIADLRSTDLRHTGET